MKASGISVQESLGSQSETMLRSIRWDSWVLGLILIVLSVPMLMGSFPEKLAFIPEAVLSGEWWRLVTHPFVHVSWYHLLLDGAAFLLLYASLREPAWWRRLLYVGAGAAGSVATAWCVTGLENGLCGLSGVAHGLMAVSALEMATGSRIGSVERRLGWISFVAVLGKAGYEVFTGHMFLEFLHFGLMGSPVAISHAGGILGALIVWWIQCVRRSPSRKLFSRRT